jgi:hypothetical protein
MVISEGSDHLPYPSNDGSCSAPADMVKASAGERKPVSDDFMKKNERRGALVQ